MTNSIAVRKWWKRHYRAMRIARREAYKASLDMMLYGAGAVLIPNNGDDPKHIPFNDVYMSSEPEETP